MNTNTQKLVFSKMTNQKLGAIEDAIENSQADALSWIESMRINYQDLDNTISETIDAIMVEIDRLDEYSKELQAEYLEANENFREVNKGLLDNNIEGGQFNEDTVKEMTSNFQDKISNVVRLVQISYDLASR